MYLMACCVEETNTTLLRNYPPIKFFLKMREKRNLLNISVGKALREYIV